jgi:hypothetical protein
VKQVYQRLSQPPEHDAGEAAVRCGVAEVRPEGFAQILETRAVTEFAGFELNFKRGLDRFQ